MARRSRQQDQDLSLVESTGNVEFDGAPVTVEQPAENQSTGNVKYEAPGTTEVSHYTEDVVVRAETPGPVTFTVAGLPGIQTKVVTPPESQPAEATTTAEVKDAGSPEPDTAPAEK